MTSLTSTSVYLGPTLVSDSISILLNLFFDWCMAGIQILFHGSILHSTRESRENSWVKIDQVVQMDTDLTSPNIKK